MDSYPTNLPPPRKQGMGCFAKGCLTLVVIAILMIGLVGVFAYKGYQKIAGYVSQSPTAIRLAPGTDEQYQALETKLTPFLSAIQSNHRETVELAAEDLNMLVARDPNFADLHGRAFFSMAHDNLNAEISAPLGEMRTSSTEHYYYNGTVSTGLMIDDGEVQLLPHSMTANGHPIPAWAMQLLNNHDFMKSFDGSFNDSINKNPRLRDFLRHLRSARVVGDHLVLTSAGEPVAAPSPAP